MSSKKHDVPEALLTSLLANYQKPHRCLTLCAVDYAALWVFLRLARSVALIFVCQPEP